MNIVIQIIILLGAALLFGKIARVFKQPAVLGELIGGVILGPTVLGVFAPDFAQTFLGHPGATSQRDALVKAALLLFLFRA